MTKKKRGKLYVSSGVLIFIWLVGMVSLIFNIFMIIDIESRNFIIVDYVGYYKGTPEYGPIIQKMKENYLVSVAISALVFCVSGIFLFLRKKQQEGEISLVH